MSVTQARRHVVQAGLTTIILSVTLATGTIAAANDADVAQGSITFAPAIEKRIYLPID